MKCPITGLPCTNKRVIHVTDINGEDNSYREMHLCETCGNDIVRDTLPKNLRKSLPQVNPTAPVPKQIQEQKLPNDPVIELLKTVAKQFNFPNIPGLPIDNYKLKELPGACPDCKQTIEEMIRSSKLGCPTCYSHFSEILMPVIKQSQDKATKHIGKKPKHVVLAKNLLDLEKQLTALVKEENYEEAAKVRDKIKEIKSSK